MKAAASVHHGRATETRATRRRDRPVVETRASRSRPGAGIVVFEHRAYNQDNELVCQGRRTALMQGGAA